MKDKENALSRTKYKLSEKKRKGQKEVIWTLKKEQKDYIEGSLHYKVEPYLYRVQTRPLKGYSKVNNALLKELHHAYKQGKKEVVKRLTNEQLKILKEYSYSVKVAKYKVFLS